MAGPVNGPLRLTKARWYNKRIPRRGLDGESYYKWVKSLADKGQLAHYAYGTDTPSYGRSDLQANIICAPHTGVIAIDVDSWSRLSLTPLGRILAQHRPISIRQGGEHRHYLIDARGVPAGQWPAQGALYGDKDIGHIKSNGWIPVPGSRHYTDELYEPVIGPGGTSYIITATPELVAAMAEAVSVPSVHGPASGNGGGHDGELAALALSLGLAGLGKEEVYRQWCAAAVPRDPGWPFDRGDFERHWRNVPAKVAKIRAGNAAIAAAYSSMAAGQSAGGVSAGQRVVSRVCESLPLTQLSDQAERWKSAPPEPVKTLSKLDAKVRAETRHRHRLSTDNSGAPEGFKAAYTGMAQIAKSTALASMLGPPRSYWDELARIAGFVPDEARKPPGGFCLHRSQVPKFQAEIKWCLEGGNTGVPLLEELPGGWLRFLDDPGTAYHKVKCVACGRNHSSENYPNAPLEERCPVIGLRMDTKSVVLAIRATPEGSVASHYQVAMIINHPEFRRAMGLEGCCYVSKQGVAKAMSRAIAEGGAERDTDAVLYRRGRRWQTDVPAHYMVRGTYAQQELERMSAFIMRFWPGLAKRLRKWADAQGPPVPAGQPAAWPVAA